MKAGYGKRPPYLPTSLRFSSTTGRVWPRSTETTMRHSLLLTTVFVAAFTIFASSALGLPQLAAAASWAALFALFYDRLGESNRAPERKTSAP